MGGAHAQARESVLESTFSQPASPRQFSTRVHNMKRILHLVSAGSLVLLAVSTAQAANIFATNPSGIWYNANPSGGVGNTIGIPFTVGSTPVSVSALGFFDELEDGLIGAHTVGIYTTSQTLLGSVTIPSEV